MRTKTNFVKWYYKGKETHCVISNNNEEKLATGVVTKFHKDKPNKRLARDTSFRRAMDDAKAKESLSKEERSTIWDTYRNTIKQPV